MTKMSVFNLEKLFSGSLEKLRIEAEYFSRLTDHNPELGRLNETHLVSFLKSYLPPKFGIGTGFIVSGGDNPKQSQQCDIVIYDAVNNAPFYSSAAWSIFPIEMVYAVIEVKTSLHKNDSLEDSFKKCREIRGMARTADGKPNKSYVIQLPPENKKPAQFAHAMMELPPRFYIFGYSGWETIKGLEKNFKEVSKKYPDAHIHGICNLTNKGSLFMGHKAFTGGDYQGFDEDGFRYFLMNMPFSLNSMLPPHRNGLFFDMVDTTYYQGSKKTGKKVASKKT